MTNRLLHSVCLPAILIVSHGCAYDGEDDLDDLEDEETSEAQQAVLGDMDCANGTRDVYIEPGCDLELGETCNYTTPDATYGNDFTSGETCQEYMVLEMPTPGGLEGGETMSVEFYAAIWSFAPDNEEDCEDTKVEIAAYNFDESGSMYELIGTNSITGTWNGTACSIPLVYLNTTLNCTAPPGSMCEKWPYLAARAFTRTSLVPIIRRVSLGAYRTDL